MKPKEDIPRAIHGFLRFFLRRELIDEVTGDLREKYDYERRVRSRFVCSLIIWYEAFHYLRPFAIGRRTYNYNSPYPMYKSYLKTALRNMTRSKLHTFINIAGLSVGMAITIAIALWIIDELSYEKHFKNYARIGRIHQNLVNNGKIQTWQAQPWPLAEELRKNYGSDFEHVVLTTEFSWCVLGNDTTRFTRTGIFAEPAFTKVFDLHLLAGTDEALKKDPAAILLSESTARTYFGQADPIGKMLMLDRQHAVTVAGVYDDMPSTSEFADLDFIASWQPRYDAVSWAIRADDPWRANAFNIYVLLTEHASFENASLKIRDAKLRKINEALAKKKPALFIHPMSRWQLYSKFEDGINTGGRIQYVWMFGIIGVFVLLMACINFMNLSTARSEKRAREVGIRKAIGSLRSQLIHQFFSESILTAFFSLAVAVLLVYLCLPYFNTIAGKQVALPWSNVAAWLAGMGFCILIGLVAGSYPALYLSSIQPGRAIKGAFKAGPSAAVSRKALVTVQFVVSIVLIIGTATVFLQIQHARNRPMGYETDGLVSIPLIPDVHKHFDAIQQQLKADGAIIAMAEATSPTTEQWSSTSQIDWSGKDPDLSVDFATAGISYDYGKTIGWEIAAGRDFSRDHPSDSLSVILNEAAVQYMGLKNPVGETVRIGGQALTVAGVAKDIITNSPYKPVTPAIYYLSGFSGNFLIARINPAVSATDALAKIEAVYKHYHNDVPFSFTFMDAAYAQKFGNEERVGQLSSVFAVLAIFISFLGIFGLSSFMAEQRTKEIGVRKVMGASIFNIWTLMSKSFVALALLSSIIAAPTAYFLLSSWLSGYAYHTTMPWWIFAAAISGTLALTVAAVSWHTLTAASANPVKSLRSD